MLGFFQLGLPCMFLVVVARHLPHKRSRWMALLEVVFRHAVGMAGAPTKLLQPPHRSSVVPSCSPPLALNDFGDTRRGNTEALLA